VRVAALYDIHGNLPALEAVLADVPADAAIVVGGDVVAGPWPADCIDALRTLGDRVVWIRGNCERELVDGGDDALVNRTPPLPEETLAFLAPLPLTQELWVDGLGRVCFCHATPTSDMPIVTPATPDEIVAERFAGTDADVVVCGHTHVQLDRRVADLRVVNAGSVGMAYEDEPGAYWALLGPDVELRRSAYDVDAAIAAMLASGFGELPRATRQEAIAFFEREAARRGER
jgi:predicted phosphodiesterase